MSALPNDKLFRKDSLYARLKTDEAREQVFAWMAVDCLGPKDTAAKIQETFDVTTSAAAVHEMVARCGLAWRIQQAAKMAADQEKALPADIEEVTRLRLRQQYRDAIFENLSRGELLAFKQHDLAEQKFAADVERTKVELKQKDKALTQKDTALKQKDRALQQSERRVKMLEATAKDAKEKLKALTTGKTKAKGLTPETMRRIEEAAKLL